MSYLSVCICVHYKICLFTLIYKVFGGFVPLSKNRSVLDVHEMQMGKSVKSVVGKYVITMPTGNALFKFPANGAALLGIGGPHYHVVSSANDSNNTNTNLLQQHQQVLQNCTHPESKAFFKKAAKILCDTSCTEHASFIHSIALKTLRERTVHEPAFQLQLTAIVAEYAPSLPAETQIIIADCMEVTASDPSKWQQLQQQRAVERMSSSASVVVPASGFGALMVMQEVILGASEFTPQQARVRELEIRQKLFKEANQKALQHQHPLQQQKGGSGSGCATAAASKPAKTKNAAPTSASPSSLPMIESSTPEARTSFPLSVEQRPPREQTEYIVDIHSKSNDTYHRVAHTMLASLRALTEEAKEIELRDSPVRLLHRKIDEALAAAKQANGTALVEGWHAEKDKERSDAGTFFGDLVEDESWKRAMPFILQTVEDANLELGCGSIAWKKWSMEERLAWLQRCMVLDLSDEEIAAAERCTCAACLPECARGPHIEFPTDLSSSAASSTAATPAMRSSNYSNGKLPSGNNNNDDDDDLVTPPMTPTASATSSGGLPGVKPQHLIRNPERSASSIKEKFKTFRRYCWRMQLPFLRLVKNVGYTAPKTKDRPSVRGELDGMLVDVCYSRGKGLTVLAAMEVKHNAADLVKARDQRERFVGVLRTSPGMVFTNKEAAVFGRHMELTPARFEDVFLQAPVERWLFLTVAEKPWASLPIFSSLSHLFVRSMINIASHVSDIPPLPPCPEALRCAYSTSSPTSKAVSSVSPASLSSPLDVDVLGTPSALAAVRAAAAQKKSQKTSNLRTDASTCSCMNHSVSPCSPSASGAAAAAAATMTTEWLRPWSESVRAFFVDKWQPSDIEAQRITENLLAAWRKMQHESLTIVDEKTGEKTVTVKQPPSRVLEEDMQIRAQGKAGCIGWVSLMDLKW